MKNFDAHFSNLNPKKQKNNFGFQGQVVPSRCKSPREQLCIVCMKNFDAHFSNLNPKKQKKIILASKGRWCPAGANRLASNCALCA
jgi:hypothetical protein